MLTLKREHDDRYTAFDGRLYLERRPKLSPFWQVRTSFQSRQMTRTTKCADLRSAAEWAEKWYLSLRYKLANGEPVENRHTLAFAFREFINHHEKLIETGESNAKKVKRYRDTWNNIKERLGNVAVDRITFDTLQQFKDWRVASAKKPTDPKKGRAR